MSRDSWRDRTSPTPTASRAVLVAVGTITLVVLVLLGVWLFRDTDGQRREEVAEAAGAFGDCYRVDARVDGSPLSGTMCADGTLSGVWTVESQPAEVLKLSTETYVKGNDFTWAALGIVAPRGVAGWALYAAGDGLIPDMNVSPSAIAEAADSARVVDGTLEMPDYTVDLRKDGSLVVSRDAENTWTLTPDSSRSRGSIDAAVVEATVTPLQVTGDGYGTRILRVPEAPPAPGPEAPPAPPAPPAPEPAPEAPPAP